MKIFIINPDYGVTKEQMAHRCSILQNYVGNDVELYMECLTKNHIEIDSALDAALAAPEIISMACKAQQQGFDAVVLYCFSDPAIDACRELLAIPIIGAGQAACLQAPLISRQSGLLLANTGRLAEKQLYVEQCGVALGRISAIGGIDEAGIDFWQQRELTLELLAKAGKQLMAKHNVQALILGCLSFLGLAGPLSKRLGVPVIDPAIAAVTAAEAIVKQGLCTSRKAYPQPPERKRMWSGGEL